MLDSLPLNQVIVGSGSPLAPQVKLAGLPSTALVSAGGSEITGRPARYVSVVALVDWHVGYLPIYTFTCRDIYTPTDHAVLTTRSCSPLSLLKSSHVFVRQR